MFLGLQKLSFWDIQRILIRSRRLLAVFLILSTFYCLQSIPDNNTDCGFLTVHICPTCRLGNQMFSYAALYGIARRNNRKIVLSRDVTKQLLHAFPNLPGLFLTSEQIKKYNFVGYKSVTSKCCTFNKNWMKLPCHQNVSIAEGYPFSWKYFAQVKNEIRQEFRFADEILQPCLQDIHSIRKDNCLLVGTHMRRGDFTNADLVKCGFLSADKTLFSRAVDYFRKRQNISVDSLTRTNCFSFHSKCIKFLLLGDDYIFNKHVSEGLSDVVLLQPSTPAMDMCILSHCNHSIISTGTYGWMTAFLTNGITVYQKEQARSGSSYAQEFTMTDYVFPDWVAM